MTAKGSATGQWQNDGYTILLTLGGTVSKGDVWEGAACIGVYEADGVSGDVVAVRLKGEVTLTKESGVAFTAGDLLFWDATNDRLDKTNTNIPAGIASEAAASGDVLADVVLCPAADGG